MHGKCIWSAVCKLPHNVTDIALVFLPSGVPAKRQHPYRRETTPTQMESRQTRKMTRSVSLGSNLVRSPCAAASTPVKKEPVELEVTALTALLHPFINWLSPFHLHTSACVQLCLFTADHAGSRSPSIDTAQQHKGGTYAYSWTGQRCVVHAGGLLAEAAP